MRNTHLWIVLGSLAGGALLWPGAVRGQDFDAATMLYGQGVHAYFAGNCPQAESHLSNALEMNSQDPRTYYFRALSLLRLGRTAEARGDMMTGAALEAQRPNRWGIGAALERVQGYDRLLLEQFRRQARLAAALNGGPSGGQAITGRQPEVLRERVVIPLDEYLRPGVPQPAARGAVDTTVPRTFAPSGDRQPPATGDRRAPAETPDDPFRDDPQAPARRAPSCRRLQPRRSRRPLLPPTARTRLVVPRPRPHPKDPPLRRPPLRSPWKRRPAATTKTRSALLERLRMNDRPRCRWNKQALDVPPP